MQEICQCFADKGDEHNYCHSHSNTSGPLPWLLVLFIITLSEIGGGTAVRNQDLLQTFRDLYYYRGSGVKMVCFYNHRNAQRLLILFHSNQ